MEGLSLLDEARQAGLRVSVDGTTLIVQGPKAAEFLARKLLDRKPELMPLLAEERSWEQPSQSSPRSQGAHSDLGDLSEEFQRTGRIRIETVAGAAWLVASYDQADDIHEGAVYSVEVWPYFVALSPEEKLQIHEFLCGLGGGRFDHVEDAE